MRDIPARDLLGLHADVLNERGIDLDQTFDGAELVRVDGDQLHPHRREAGLVPDVVGIHGRPPVEDFAFLVRGLAPHVGHRFGGRGRGDAQPLLQRRGPLPIHRVRQEQGGDADPDHEKRRA